MRLIETGPLLVWRSCLIIYLLYENAGRHGKSLHSTENLRNDQKASISPGKPLAIVY